MPLTETEKVLTYILVPFGIAIFFIGLHVGLCWLNDRKEQRIYLKAHKPTKAEIRERNHIDWLMMPEEMEDNPIINLHETEKAIS